MVKTKRRTLSAEIKQRRVKYGVRWPDGSMVVYDPNKSLESQFAGEYLKTARKLGLGNGQN